MKQPEEYAASLFLNLYCNAALFPNVQQVILDLILLEL